jgi:hypothetical protein
MMQAIAGLTMIGLAIALLCIARPRRRKVVGFMANETIARIHTMVLVTLLFAGSLMAFGGMMPPV